MQTYASTTSRQIRKIKRSSKYFNIARSQLQRGAIQRLLSHSHDLHNQRPLDVYLPPGYDESRRYPVLYMHDGNNLFDPRIAFGGMPWHVDKTLDLLISLHWVEPVIVVGVFNTMGRNEEYTWTRMRTPWGAEGGRGPLYARYLVEEVKPLIDQRYATLAGPEHTAVMGSSLGGLISLYLGLHYPQVFGKLGLVSPSLWWNHREPLQDAWHVPQGLQIWLDMGTREGSRHCRVEQNPNIRNTRALKQILQQKGYAEGRDLAYLEDRGALHNEWWWGQRLHLPLIFFWGRSRAQNLIWR